MPKLQRTIAILAVMGGALGPTVAQAGTPPPTSETLVTPVRPDQDAKIERGEIVVGVINKHPIYHLDVYGAINSSPERIWSAITSYDRYVDFLPLVVESNIKRRASKTTFQYVRMRPPWPLHDHWMVNANVENKPRWNLSWTMADGNLKLEHGYWQLVPMGPNRTRLQYHLTVDPWLDIIPGWLVEFATVQVLPDVIKGVRKRVNAK